MSFSTPFCKGYILFHCIDVGLRCMFFGGRNVCARVILRVWAGLMRLWLRLLMLKVVCRLSRDLVVMNCAKKM